MEAENQRPVTPINKERLITCPGAPKKKDRNWADLLEDDFLEIEPKKLNFDEEIHDKNQQNIINILISRFIDKNLRDNYL